MVVSRSGVGQLIDDAATTATPMNQQVLEFLKPLQVNGKLALTPLGMLADITAAEAVITAIQALLLALSRHHHVDQVKKASGLRWQFIERAAKDFMG